MGGSGEKTTKNGGGAKAGGARVTPRDHHILRFVVAHGVVTVYHVARFAFGTGGGEEGFDPASESAVYRRLRKLKSLGLIRHERILWNRPGVYRATEAGARMSGAGLPPARIDLADLEHDMRVVTLSLSILGSSLYGARWISEREIRHAVLGRTRSTETGLMRAGKGWGRIPDGILLGLGGERVAVEVELSGKRDAAYAKIMNSYAAKHRAEIPEGMPGHHEDREAHLREYILSGGRVDGVAYYCASDAVRARVAQAQGETLRKHGGATDLAFWALDLDEPQPLRMDRYHRQSSEKLEARKRRHREEEGRRRRAEEPAQPAPSSAEHRARLREAWDLLTERERREVWAETGRQTGRYPNDPALAREAELAIISAAERKRAVREGGWGMAGR